MTTALEERIAHLERLVEDLSDVVARQDRDLQRLTQLVEHLVSREAEREATESGGIVIGNERPPHY